MLSRMFLFICRINKFNVHSLIIRIIIKMIINVVFIIQVFIFENICGILPLTDTSTFVHILSWVIYIIAYSLFCIAYCFGNGMEELLFRGTVKTAVSTHTIWKRLLLNCRIFNIILRIVWYTIWYNKTRKNIYFYNLPYIALHIFFHEKLGYSVLLKQNNVLMHYRL